MNRSKFLKDFAEVEKKREEVHRGYGEDHMPWNIYDAYIAVRARLAAVKKAERELEVYLDRLEKKTGVSYKDGT